MPISRQYSSLLIAACLFQTQTALGDEQTTKASATTEYRLLASATQAPQSRERPAPVLQKDPHYNALGFFDIHLCNWPDRPSFLKVLFSTTHYNAISEMQVFTPDGQLLTRLNKDTFMPLPQRNKPDKRVYMLDIDTPPLLPAGWYRIEVSTHDGRRFEARDYVLPLRLQRTTGLQPSQDREASLPVTLQWQAVEGAGYYQVFVRDEWTGKLVFQSPLTADTRLQIPREKLEAGGYYSWRVHARDTNEHILLGDFHMGSLSRKAFFSTTD